MNAGGRSLSAGARSRSPMTQPPASASSGTLPEPDGVGTVVVATGGTSDMPVAEEAALTAEALGNQVVRLYDVGVAGLHRLLASLDELMSARVHHRRGGHGGRAGQRHRRTGGLPGHRRAHQRGLRRVSFGGVAALLSMLNSCASGVSVVNIDNGFGAGYLASMINHMGAKPMKTLYLDCAHGRCGRYARRRRCSSCCRSRRHFSQELNALGIPGVVSRTAVRAEKCGVLRHARSP